MIMQLYLFLGSHNRLTYYYGLSSLSLTLFIIFVLVFMNISQPG